MKEIWGKWDMGIQKDFKMHWTTKITNIEVLYDMSKQPEILNTTREETWILLSYAMKQ